MANNDRPMGLPIGDDLHRNADIQFFGSPGTFGWIRPPIEKYSMVRVIAFGAGGGGSGGGTGASSGGGGGGSGANIVMNEFPISVLDATEVVTVGLGGTGGASGSAGNSGTASSFTVRQIAALYATNGFTGTGGAGSGGSGGASLGFATASVLWGEVLHRGSAGGDGKTDPTNGVAAISIPDDSAGLIYRLGCPGGGGGGGSGGVGHGGNGGDAYQLTGGSQSGDRRGNSFRFDIVSGDVTVMYPVPYPIPYPGSGGAGGSDVSAGAGGPNGGPGGFPGAGGGGGAGHSGTAGTGGNGGDGAVWVICF